MILKIMEHKLLENKVYMLAEIYSTEWLMNKIVAF